ncbi:hypothetical protein ACO0QE_002547 [Hanseniaspora vineae]
MSQKLKRYVPGPGDPALPPQLSEFANKTTDEVLEELNKMPFFMTEMGNEENDTLEALKAMAYEGEPHEIAGNFKNQGNEMFKLKQYKGARELYTKALDVKPDPKEHSELLSILLSNRAACELELKNYRKCINDCKKSLNHNSKSVKAYYRMAKAFCLLDKLDEAKSALEFGMLIDNSNKSLHELQKKIEDKEMEILAKHTEKLKMQEEKHRKSELLKASMDLRAITNVNSKDPADILKEAKIYLEEENVVDSQMIYPALVLYPTTDEFDFVAEVGELSTPIDILNMIMQRPQEYFEQLGHENFSVKNMQPYMETLTGGLVKVGKKITFHNILKTEKPVIPLFDNSLRVYFVPKQESESWLAKWDKAAAMERRA